MDSYDVSGTPLNVPKANLKTLTNVYTSVKYDKNVDMDLGKATTARQRWVWVVRRIVLVSTVTILSFIELMTICMHQCKDSCYNSMQVYVNIVSKSVYNGSNVLFLGVLSNPIVTGQ